MGAVGVWGGRNGVGGLAVDACAHLASLEIHPHAVQALELARSMVRGSKGSRLPPGAARARALRLQRLGQRLAATLLVVQPLGDHPAKVRQCMVSVALPKWRCQVVDCQ